jgi:ATP-dependent Clp protease ATP-binding subunit ClpC
MLPGSAQRLLDVGEGSTSLASRVRAQPLCLVLLDEVEKAHPEVFDLLLGVLGEGRLTDSYGRLIDFRMSVIVMTSNLGAAEASPVGFEKPHRDYSRAVRDHFRPELTARLDHIVSFRALEQPDVLSIVDLELEKVRARTGLQRRSLSLDIEPDARARLAELGFHPARGARPLKRVMEERVVAPIAALLARDPHLKSRRLVVTRSPRQGKSGESVIPVDP